MIESSLLPQPATVARARSHPAPGLPTRRHFGYDLVDDVDLSAVVTRLLAAQPADDRLPFVVTPNVDYLVRLAEPEHAPLADVVRRSRYVLPDGQPLVWASHLLGGPLRARLPGSGLFPLVWERLVAEARPTLCLVSHAAVAHRLRSEHPGAAVVVAPWIEPDDEVGLRRLVDELWHHCRTVRPEHVFVGIGFPKQQQVALALHARYVEHDLLPMPVFLMLGAALDMHCGLVQRAPRWVQDSGFEWLYRFAHEPRRLFRRYFVTDLRFFPMVGRELWRTRRDRARLATPVRRPVVEPLAVAQPTMADVGVVVVTYDSAEHLPRLVASLPDAADGLRLHVVVVDNDSTDGTADVARGLPGVHVVEAGGNRGYAAGINLGRAALPRCDAVLVLNPDLVLRPGSVRRLFETVQQPYVGAAVPALLDEHGEVRRSLRREPRLLRQVGEALLGDHLAQRPRWASEIVREPEAYRYHRPVDWATGACVMVSRACDQLVGDWDESFFLYSEEVDHARRTRQAGFRIEYVPTAEVVHAEGGSGRNASLVALSAVNRVRYYRAHHGRVASSAYLGAVLLQHALRSSDPAERHAARTLVRRGTPVRVLGRDATSSAALVGAVRA